MLCISVYVRYIFTEENTGILSEKKQRQNIPYPGQPVTPDAVVLSCLFGEGMGHWNGDFC